MSKRTDPWFKFYPSDWRAEASLRAVSLAARALWMEMLCLMHEAEPRGHLLLNGRPMTDAQLSALAGVPVNTAQELLGELEAAGTFSRTRAGVIYSRRMRKDTAVSAKQRANVEKRWKSTPTQETENTDENEGRITKAIPKKPEARDQSKKDDKSSYVAGGDVRTAFDEWNSLASRLALPTAKDLTPGRRKAIGARIASAGLEGWREALSAVEASSHCRGDNDRGWRADIDFVANPTKFQKLREGSYGPVAVAASAPVQTFPGPAALRASVVAAKDEAFALAWIDPCGWDEPNRALIARNTFALNKLRTELGEWMKRHKVRAATTTDSLDQTQDRAA